MKQNALVGDRPQLVIRAVLHVDDALGDDAVDLLLPGDMPHHIGSIDVDLALDHRTLKEAGYRSIMQLLLSRGYIKGEQPFIFYREATEWF